ncbi:MAG: hypothetical protein HYW06_04020, partial [Gemmatimonadetes bacterium]|nr:hypothetical protein [Gemmatimonadota bacterium]
GWNNVWAVGASGTILRFDGVSWQPVTSPVTGTFRAVSGSGPNNVFAVGGTGSQIAHFNGSIWEAQSIPASYTFYDVWAASGNEAIAVGYQAILRYNGSAWTAMLHAAPGWVLGVWGVADGQLRAVGQGGEVFRGLRGAGPIVKTEVTPSGATNNGISTTRQYRALPRDASDNVVTPASLAWTSHNTNVATVSSAGVATTTGSGQTVLEANADGVLGYGLFTVTVSTATAVNLFDSTYSGNTNFLWSIWGRNANNIYAVGGNGTILRTTDGTNWGSVGPGGGHFRGIWGSADNDIWAVGDGGRIAH